MRALPALLLAAGATSIAPDRFVEWRGGTARYSAEGVTVTVEALPCPAADEACGEGAITPRVTVSRAGAPPLVLTERSIHPPYMPLRIAIGRLDAREGAAVLLNSYTGGAHCCQRLVAVLPTATGWRDVEFGQPDMGTPEWPRDRSGDGRADFVIPDQRFLYRFASYADSYAPPRVFNLVGGRWAEVSADPAFRPLFERDLARAERACRTRTEIGSQNGACAAFAADAARLGRLETVWPTVVRYAAARPQWGRTDACRVPEKEGVCPSGQVVRRDFPAALRAFLRGSGYSR